MNFIGNYNGKVNTNQLYFASNKVVVCFGCEKEALFDANANSRFQTFEDDLKDTCCTKVTVEVFSWESRREAYLRQIIRLDFQFILSSINHFIVN
jgi:hypothetical protein